MPINSGIYAEDGSLRVTVVDGNTFVGLYAADGSYNVKVRSDEFGIYDQSGAILVTVRSTPGAGIYTPNDNLYVSTSPYVYGSQRVTVVSGSLTPPGPGGAGTLLFTVPLLTQAS